MNNLGVWHPICVQNWTSSVSDEICRFIGFGYLMFLSILFREIHCSLKLYIFRPGLSYSLLARSKVLPLNTLEPAEGFLWNTSKSLQAPLALHKRDLSFTNEDYNFAALHSIVKRQSASSTASDCKFVNVTCSNQLCGIRPSLGGWDALPNIEGRFPWHATLFLEGQYICGATLLAPQWLLVSSFCFRNIK